MRPFTRARFRSPRGGQPRSISIKGIPGLCQLPDVPADVYDGILKGAAYRCCQSLLQGLSQGYVAVRDDDGEIRRSIELLQTLGRPWGLAARRIREDYRRSA
jgi:hypothetical protein